MTLESRTSSRLLAYLQLMRLPNVFTAMADVLMGFWLTHETLSPAGAWLLLLASSSFLYLGGMVLNDVYDLEQDRRERPQRPLPSGRIEQDWAAHFGYMLLTIGLLTAAVVPVGSANFGRPVAVAAALAALILLYDRWLKRTPLGPIAMGSCRFLNVLLGMSAASDEWSTWNWTIAGGIGLYIVGVTWFARREASSSRRLQLVAAIAPMLGGMALLWWWPRMVLPEKLFATLQFQPESWTIAWVLIALAIGWRFVQAIFHPQPSPVQAAVKTGIVSIIVLDAITVFALRGPFPAIAILFLIVPTLALGAWVYST